MHRAASAWPYAYDGTARACACDRVPVADLGSGQFSANFLEFANIDFVGQFAALAKFEHHTRAHEAVADITRAKTISSLVAGTGGSLAQCRIDHGGVAELEIDASNRLWNRAVSAPEGGRRVRNDARNTVEHFLPVEQHQVAAV